MKKILLTLTAVALFSLQLEATVLTVSNHPAGGAQYNSLFAAYNAAVNGDTLMLEGTDINYDHCTSGLIWNKSLTVIGIGFNPDKQNPRTTRINRFNGNCGQRFDIGVSGAGSRFYGIYFVNSSTESIFLTGAASNLTFENCRFAGQIYLANQTVNNILITNCIFDSDNNSNFQIGSGNVVSGLIFTSCVFDGYIEGNSNPFVSMIVNNCLFLSTSTGSFNNVLYPTISNCIFMNAFPGGTTNGTWLNNMCRVAGTLPPVGGGGNIGSGNIDNTNPNFTTYTLGAMYSTIHNYQLQAGSAAIGSGTAGADMGVHGSGSLFSNYGEVLHNPIMRSVIIQNPVINPSGTLNVDVHTTKPHEE